ncbi:YybH family protein [Sphingorhabdus contaminans]|uniref:YybH family protein n=1 Tax=Sphingorhabdus contaminans TaxID=1343899 RepID=UPI003D2DF662
MIGVLTALSLAAAPLAPQPTAPEATAESFLKAFKEMDEVRFDNFFAPDVTMFFPEGPFPDDRIEGRDAVLAAFHSFFKLVRERGRTSLNIAPVEQRMQVFGDVAVLTFELQGEETIGRRSIVFSRLGGDWRIVHFHASAVDK